MHKKIFLLIFFLSFSLLSARTKLLVQGNGEEKLLTLAPSTAKGIKKRYSHLNKSDFFNISKIKNIRWIRKKLRTKKNIAEIHLKTRDDVEVSGLFINRNSNKVVVMAPGLGVVMEHMIIFSEIFKEHDILMFNWRGHSVANWYSINPLKRRFNLDFASTLGTKEEEEVFAAVNFARSIDNYEEVIGFAPCFGALVFAKAQSIMERSGKRLFNKLILDGCWSSVKSIIKKYEKDPKLIVDNQRVGFGDCYICKHNWLEGVLEWLATMFFTVDLDSLDLHSYLREVHIPVLFTHGTRDTLVNNEEFYDLWHSLASENKAALITSCTHARIFLKKKEIFAHVCNEFINSKNIREFSCCF